jgi:hypothetical protein
VSHPAVRRRGKTVALAVLVATTLLWIAFVLYLDVRYERFPAVSIGGLKILLFVYLVVFIGALCVSRLGRLASWLAARTRGG